MLKNLRSARLSYANVMVTICLALILIPPVTNAVSKIRGADIVDNTVTGRDIRNGSLSATDLAAATRSSFTDTSPWEKVPSGRTIRGGFYDEYTIQHDGDNHVLNLQLPALPRNELTDVDFAEDGNPITFDANPECTGTADAPTAPAGKLCLYLSSSSNVDMISGNMWSTAATRNLGLFYLYWTDDSLVASAHALLYGTWAYTAP